MEALTFKADESKFKNRTFKRVATEVLLLILTICFFYSELVDISQWIEVFVLGLISLYILFGLASYPSSLKHVRNSVVDLANDSISITSHIHSQKIPLSSIKSVEKTDKNGEIESICLNTRDYGLVKLAPYENMEKLFTLLQNQSGSDEH